MYFCEYPCLNDRVRQRTLGRCHPSAFLPNRAEGGWEGRLGLTSHLTQGCIELEMDEAAAETRIGVTCVFRLVHSHPPNPPHADGIFLLPDDAVLLPKET